MNSKLITGLILISLAFSACNKSNENYVLEDTWGDDGNWGKTKTVSNAVPPASTNTPDKEEEPEKAEVKKEEVKKEAPPKETEAPKVVKKEEPKKETPKQKETEEKAPMVTLGENDYKNTKFNYGIKEVNDWEQKDGIGSIGVNFVKNSNGSNLNVSVGTIKNLKEENLDSSFKKKYLSKLNESFSNLQIVNNSQEAINGKNYWSLSYIFTKDGSKLQQKQVFIPHKNNTIVLNMISTEEGFFKSENDFNQFKNSLVLLN